MAIVALSSSPVTLDSGSSDFVSVVNTGAVDVTVARGSQSFVLRPNQSRTVYPEGVAVTAIASGTGQVTTLAQAAQVTQSQQVTANTAGIAANTAAIAGLPGTYGRLPATVGNRLRRASTRAEARNSLDLGVMASPPTITIGTTNQDATLTKSYRSSVDGRQYFRITGGTAQQGISAFASFVVAPVVTMPSGSGGNTSGDGTHNSYGWAVEFQTDSPRVMLRHLQTTNFYMVEVNDQPVSSAGLTFTGGGTNYSLIDFSVGSATIVAATGVFTTSAAHGLAVGDQVVLGAITTTTGVSANVTYFVKTVPSTTTFTLSATPTSVALTLTGDGSTAAVAKVMMRKFRVEYFGASGFDGVYVLPQYTIWPPKTENAVTVAVVGDSIEQGTGAVLPNGTWSKVAAKLLGWTDVRQIAFGGTGFTNPGSFNKFGAALRVTDAQAATPDLIVIPASQNDDSQPTLQADALSTFQAYRAAFPTVPIVVMGADASSSGPSASRLAVEAAVLAAFNQWADANSWFVPCSNASDGSWFTGTGYAGATTGSGNRDRFGFDTAHPNDAGHVWRARRFAAAFRSLVLPYVP